MPRDSKNKLTTFFGLCEEMGLSQTSLNAQRLRAAIKAQSYDLVLFMIAGYDFLFHPSDRKFEGIWQLFVREGGQYELNRGAASIDAFQNAMWNPSIGASVEGTSWPMTPGAVPKPGAAVAFNKGLMLKPAGVREGGAANYNLQVKALDLLISHADGVDRQQTITVDSWDRLMMVCRAPGVVTLGGIGEEYLAGMGDAVAPYWGADRMNLGL